MKKMIITMVLGTMMLLTTGCGTEVKAQETETYVETEIIETETEMETYEETETEEELDEGYTVEEAKEEVEWLIEDMLTDSEYYFEKDGVIDYELMMDVISILMDIEYDEEYYYGFDIEQFYLDYVTAFYEHGHYTFDEAVLEYYYCMSEVGDGE